MNPEQHWKEAERLLEESVNAGRSSDMRCVMIKAAKLHFWMATEGLRLGWPSELEGIIQDKSM